MTVVDLGAYRARRDARSTGHPSTRAVPATSRAPITFLPGRWVIGLGRVAHVAHLSADQRFVAGCGSAFGTGRRAAADDPACRRCDTMALNYGWPAR